jgi:mono/diheme cytochrome c family protein
MLITGRVLCAALLPVLLAGSARAQDVKWTVPPDAVTLKSPLASTPAALKTGKNVFTSHCQKCHGPEGKGNGPYSDPKHPAADLTGARLKDDADGVLFYKVWNGGAPMPAFKSELERDEVWAVIQYVKTLRKE